MSLLFQSSCSWRSTTWRSMQMNLSKYYSIPRCLWSSISSPMISQEMIILWSSSYTTPTRTRKNPVWSGNWKSCRSETTSHISLVCDLVNSRWFPDESDSEHASHSNFEGPSCLRKVSLHVWEDKVEEFEKTIMPLLAECGDEGLDVEFMER